MKKLLGFILIITMLSLCACTADKEKGTTTSEKDSEHTQQKSSEKKENASSDVSVGDSADTNDVEDNFDADEGKDVASPLAGKIIVVDAGHGLFSAGRQEAIAPGSTQTKPAFVSGTAGKNQTEEELNLAVALKLQTELEKCGATVYMTRETHQTELSNIGRAQFANELNADISVKIHADGSSNTSISGISMLIPGNQYISDANLVQQSRTAGTFVLESVVETTGAIDRGLSVRNDMTGFNWSTVPVILLEMGFMSNPQEDALMETDEYQNKIVSGIIMGLENYFES